MIFVTVGHQMAFDRLVRWIDLWKEKNPEQDVFAQIGKKAYIPRHVRSQPYLSPAEFERALDQSSAVVAHAGTGIILSALYFAKPLLVVPRLGNLGETRNDHQVATAEHFASLGLVKLATSETEFMSSLGTLRTFRPSATVGKIASPGLIKRLADFINE
jgi:UDP-N-acetylglucosamine transferase subunit ALG13